MRSVPHGIGVPMITTDLTSATSPVARPLLTTAARHGVPFFKAGYWRYSASRDVRAQVDAASQAIAGLAALAADCGIEMGVHNHAGYIGGATWDIAPAMDKTDPKCVPATTSIRATLSPKEAGAHGRRRRTWSRRG